MTPKRLEEILDNILPAPRGCRIFKGLEIIRKYLPSADITSAEHDIVYICDATDLTIAGITEEDALELAKLSWMVEDDSLAHFV